MTNLENHLDEELEEDKILNVYDIDEIIAQLGGALCLLKRDKTTRS